MMRGDIWWADFGIPFGSEPGYKRPVLIVQDNSFNNSRISTVVIIPFSTNLVLADAPGNVLCEKELTRLTKDSVLVVSQIYSLDRRRLVEKISTLEKRLWAEIEEGLMTVLGIKSI